MKNQLQSVDEQKIDFSRLDLSVGVLSNGWEMKASKLVKHLCGCVEEDEWIGGR